MIPPVSVVMTTYLAWPTAHLSRSRGVIRFVKAAASGPVISTWRSTHTSHNVTSWMRAQYSFSRSSKRTGKKVWLYTV